MSHMAMLVWATVATAAPLFTGHADIARWNRKLANAAASKVIMDYYDYHCIGIFC